MKLLLSIILSFCFTTFFAQNVDDQWVVENFSNLGFKENQGRYESILNEEILFFTEVGQYEVLFSNNAFVFCKQEELTPEEWRERHEKLEHGEEVLPLDLSCFKLEFQNTSLKSTIESEGLKGYTCNFQDPENGNRTIRSRAFDKLVYRNLYPHVDMVVEIPQEGGLKYSFLVYPDGNWDEIIFEYTGASILTNEDGSLQVLHDNSIIKDKAPVSYVENTSVQSQFICEDGRVSFSVDNYDHSDTLLIDPWLITDLPDMLSVALEIASDDLDNSVVIIDGSEGYLYNEKLFYYNSEGMLECYWEDIETGAIGHGDVCMNPESGAVFVSGFIGIGYGYAPRIIKLNSLGILEADEVFESQEVFRIRYNNILNKIVTGDGGLSGYDTEISTRDTDLIGYEGFYPLVEPFFCVEDAALLEVDPEDGAYYLLASYAAGIFGDCDNGNKLYKLSADDPAETLWRTNTGHDFKELMNTTYAVGGNGVNGIACGNVHVYTYDGNMVVQYNKDSGERLDSLFLDAAPFTQYGIDTDACENLYLGTGDSVLVLDSSFTLKGGFACPDTCYDLIVHDDRLHVCGKNFIAQFDISEFNSDVSLIATSETCDACNGSATVNTSFCEDYSLLGISWSPGGETSETINDLCSGWYVVTVTLSDGDGDEIIRIDSIEVVNESYDLTVESEQLGESCSGSCNGSITFFPTGGEAPYSYVLGGDENVSGEFIGLCAGEYPITIEDAYECTYVDVVSIESNEDFCIEVLTYNEPSCYGFRDGSITVGTIGELEGVEFEWLPENDIGGATFNELGAGTYRLIATTDEGCSDTLEIELNDPDSLYAGISIYNVLCFGDSTGSVKVDSVYNARGDLNNISFFWNPNYFDENGVGVDSAYHMSAGDYTLIINDDNGCSNVLDFTIIQPKELIATVGSQPALCRSFGYQNGNGVVYASASGGTADYDYSWEFLDGDGNSLNSTWGGRNPGTYQITIEDENGCILIEYIELDSVNPQAAFTVNSDQLNSDCEGTELVTANFTNESKYFADPNDSDSDTIFFWNLDYPNSEWQITHSYFKEMDTNYIGEAVYQVCLVALNKNNCRDTTCKNIIVHVQPEFVAPNIFTPGGNGINDKFTFEFRTLGIETFHCTIVNRWGVIVAELNDISEGWSGTDFKGDLCNDGTYFYVYEAISTNHTVFKGQGNVQLVRDD